MKVTAIVLGVMLQAPLLAQCEARPSAPVVLVSSPLYGDRIFGVIPNFQTVEDPKTKFVPLTTKQKFTLAARSTFDPFAFVGSAMGAAESHIQQSDPKYGQGKSAYLQRYGAAFTDMATQNFISVGLLAPIFHEDPRYFRLGPESHFLHRVGYAMSRQFIGRTDAGNNRISYSSILGTVMGIGLSNAYYPSASRTGSVMGSRVLTSFSYGAFNNLLPEFWPDIKQRIHRKKTGTPQHD